MSDRSLVITVAAAAFASYRNVDLGAATKVRVRACLPDPASKIKPATAVVLRDGSPEGPVLARVALPASLAHANCGYLIGSYCESLALSRTLTADLSFRLVARSLI